MKAASNLIMWLAMVLLVTLAMVLGLVLLLLAELYCPPLIRRNRHRRRQPVTAAATRNDNSGERSQSWSDSSPKSPLGSVNASDDIEKQLHQPPENQDSGRTHHLPENQDSGRTHHPPENQDSGRTHHPTENQDSSRTHHPPEMGKGCLGDSVNGCSILYISNPIYDGGNRRGSTTAGGGGGDDDKTPFETPDTSPSRLETEDSSGDEEISSSTPPLTPMRKLPAAVVYAVALKDGSDTNSNNGVSSSLSSTPCSSPSPCDACLLSSNLQPFFFDISCYPNFDHQSWSTNSTSLDLMMPWAVALLA